MAVRFGLLRVEEDMSIEKKKYINFIIRTETYISLDLKKELRNCRRTRNNIN